jgi:hypothetical protein
MDIKEYREFVLIVKEVDKDQQGLQQISTQVFKSPAGEGPEEVRSVPQELDRKLYKLENRKLEVSEIISIGKALADLVLPSKSLQLFERSLDKLQPDQGLRLRLRLSFTLTDIPWEYLYLQQSEGEEDTTGFLALDPRISLVRHEALPVSGDLDTTPKTRRLLVALSSPEERGFNPLDLAKEGDNLKKALADIPGIELDLLEQATGPGLQDKLLHNADIFHFAGHGGFKPTGVGFEGQGEIFLVDENGGAAPWSADQLAVNLRGHGVQLAFLGACQTGRRDGQNVWSGVVAALMKGGIPAAVAMQYTIWDDAAIAFSRSFYQALAAGLTLDQAVSAGRLATFNLVHPNREDVNLGKFWRDWGVPLLYLRSEQTFRLPAVTEAKDQKALVNNLSIMVNERIKTLLGKSTAIDIGVIEPGADTRSIPDMRVEMDIGTIEETGQATGVRIGTIGAARPAPAGLTCPNPNCNKPVEEGWKSCPYCRADLSSARKTCSQCNAKIPAGANFCPQCRAPIG